MATLYEITDELLQLLDMIDDPDIDPQILKDTFEGVAGEFEDKADSYAKLITEAKSMGKALKAEEDRIKARREAVENNTKRMIKTLEEAMRAVGKPKFKTTLYSFGIQKNAPSVVIADGIDLDTVPDKYIKHQDPEIDKTAVKEALKAGEVLPWAELVSTESLRIR